ncbi:MAG: MarR family transcriptional regulator [Clostridiales bacterium]|nr:MarR family transcriptional regulator [Clostridiales bacterium]
MDGIDNVNKGATMFASFRSLLRAYNDYLSAAVSEYDLSPNEIVVLSSLQNVSSASQIAKEAGVSKALVSRSVKLLKQKGLIEVTISAFDKREQDLRPTDSGVQLADVIKRANERFYNDALSHINSEAFEVTQWTLKLIMTNLNIEGGFGNEGDEG